LDLRGRNGQETGEECIMKSFIFKKMKSGRMRWNTHGREEKCI